MPRGQSEETNLRWQTRLWDSYPAKSPNLRHCQAHSQNKGLSRASRLQTGPSPARDRRGQPEPEGGNRVSREASSTKLQAGFVAKTSWDSGRLTSAGRVAARDQLPRIDTRHTWEGVLVVHPENRAAGMGEVISRSDHARQAPGHLSCSDLGRAQNASPTESAPLWSTWVPEPERLRPGKCVQPRAGLRQFPAE